MNVSELIQALEDAEYVKEILTPTTMQTEQGPMKANICEYVGLEEDPNWIALKAFAFKALVEGE